MSGGTPSVPSAPSAPSSAPAVPVHPSRPRPLGDLEQLRTAFLYQLRFYLRTWRFAGILIFVAAISIALLAVDLYRGVDVVKATLPDSSAFLASYLSNIGNAIVIAAAFLGGDAIAMDMGGGAGYLMLTLPVRRRTLLAGRYSAAALLGFVVALVYYAFAIVASLLFYGTVPSAVGLSIACAFLFGLAALAVAFFFSSFFKSPGVSIVATVLILIIALPILTAVGDLTGSEPWYSLDYGSGVVSNVFSSNFHHETTLVAHGGGGVSVTIYTFSPYLWEGLLIMGAYLVVFLLLTYVVYHRKEVKG